MYDMSGNVREWCSDGQGDDRIIKGGCYEDLNLLKVGELFKTSAYTLDRGLGFRLARTQH
jgi:formylglycine-generating enzyme required for sulfatase activity